MYRDLILHQLDDKGSLEKLEKTISKAHTRYWKPSEIKKLIENSGLCYQNEDDVLQEVLPFLDGR